MQKQSTIFTWPWYLCYFFLKQMPLFKKENDMGKKCADAFNLICNSSNTLNHMWLDSQELFRLLSIQYDIQGLFGTTRLFIFFCLTFYIISKH